MLQRLSLRDFVIVKELELEFQSGFTVLTGETGAGKSILIDAIQMGLGERSSTALIREGATRAEVALFFKRNGAVDAWLEAMGFAKTDDVEASSLLLRRTVDTQGKSRAWINGSAATAAQLRELGDLLVHIHGQHAWGALTRAQAARDLLDAYGAIDTRALQSAWRVWRDAAARLQSAQTQTQSQSEVQEQLQWQIAEVDKLSPQPDEWASLNAEHMRLEHAQSLIDAAGQAAALLVGDESARDGRDPCHAAACLHGALEQLSAYAQIEPSFEAHLSVLKDALALVEDTAHSLHAYLHKAQSDPERLLQLDARMTLWLSLARRFRVPPEQLHSTWQAWQARLAELDTLLDIKALQAAVDKALSDYWARARAVSALRQVAAKKWSASITQAMQSLAMAGGAFEVALCPCESAQPKAHGQEDVMFLVAAHAGATLRPMGKVASGGELSRIALAIAVTTSKLGVAPTLIFDEVDAGIGGKTAHTVGALMAQLSADRQVLAVTHLPQVAAKAHQQGVVKKQSSTDATDVTDTGHVTNILTISTIDWVTGDARVAEVARMLGGEASDPTAMQHAREMLE